MLCETELSGFVVLHLQVVEEHLLASEYLSNLEDVNLVQSGNRDVAIDRLHDYSRVKHRSRISTAIPPAPFAPTASVRCT